MSEITNIDEKINAGNHVKQEDLMPVADMFEDAKDGFVLTVETNVITAKRIDYFMWLRDQAYKFWGNKLDDLLDMDKRLGYLKELQQTCVETYEKVAEIAKTFEYEEFAKDDMKDYFEDIVPKVEDINTEKEMLEAELIFLCVQPYGSKMNQLHNLITDELAKRRMMDEPIAKSTLDGTASYIEESEDMA